MIKPQNSPILEENGGSGGNRTHSPSQLNTDWTAIEPLSNKECPKSVHSKRVHYKTIYDIRAGRTWSSVSSVSQNTSPFFAKNQNSNSPLFPICQVIHNSPNVKQMETA